MENENGNSLDISDPNVVSPGAFGHAIGYYMFMFTFIAYSGVGQTPSTDPLSTTKPAETVSVVDNEVSMEINDDSIISEIMEAEDCPDIDFTVFDSPLDSDSSCSKVLTKLDNTDDNDVNIRHIQSKRSRFLSSSSSSSSSSSLLNLPLAKRLKQQLEIKKELPLNKIKRQKPVISEQTKRQLDNLQMSHGVLQATTLKALNRRCRVGVERLSNEELKYIDKPIGYLHKIPKKNIVQSCSMSVEQKPSVIVGKIPNCESSIIIELSGDEKPSMDIDKANEIRQQFINQIHSDLNEIKDLELPMDLDDSRESIQRWVVDQLLDSIHNNRLNKTDP